MITDEEFRTEAERLVNLDEQSSLIEDVAIALRLGEQSDVAAEELHKMDREFLNEIVGQRGIREVDVGLGESSQPDI